MRPATSEAYDLMHRGSLVLAEIESNGIAVDVDYLEKTALKLQRRIDKCSSRILRSRVGRLWSKRFGPSANLQSATQLGVVLFEELGIESKFSTPTGGYKTDEESLSHINHPFVDDYLRMKGLAKALGTYVRAIQRETVDGFVHPFFHLHSVVSYRSSSESPNFQNQPIRDEEIGKMIRRAFIPRARNRRLIEMDFSGAEVRVSACYHRDPAMINYILNPEKDLHRDMAMECFGLPKSEVTGKIRYASKSQFVFAQFYGSWWKNCAEALWHEVDRRQLTTESGKSLRDHLNLKGWSELGVLKEGERDPTPGSFMAHIQDVEYRFWKKRFPIYDRWRREWYEDYQRRGYIRMLSGFVSQGYMARNDVINYGTQGSAFHCLLWVLIYVAKAIRKYRMRTKIINEIHDSFLGDVPTNETQAYIEICMDGIAALNRHWKWLVVPMVGEFELAEPGASWAEKQKMEKAT